MTHNRFETFAFLPPLAVAQVRLQAEDLLRKNYLPIIEFLENPTFEDVYWRLWPLPEKTETNAAWVMTQIDACARRNPYAYIRLSGYDRGRRFYAMSFIVKTPLEAA